MSTTSCERCEDFAADARKVLSQRCAPDERHCSCVPHLRAEIDRLSAELNARVTEGVRTIGALEDDIDLLLDLLGVAEEDQDSGCPLTRGERVTLAADASK